MSTIQESPAPTALLRRTACADALNAAGFPISAKTLATMVSRGGGPPYQTFGRVALYRWGEVLEWAEARLKPSRRSRASVRPLA